MDIRRALEADFDAMWPVFQAVVATGDTYAFSPTTTRQDAFAYWFGPGMTSYVAVNGLRILGMYKLRANQRDLGSHVANASFMVDPAARGTGYRHSARASLPSRGTKRRLRSNAIQLRGKHEYGRRFALEDIGIFDRRHRSKGVQASSTRIRRRLCDAPLPE